MFSSSSSSSSFDSSSSSSPLSSISSSSSSLDSSSSSTSSSSSSSYLDYSDDRTIPFVFERELINSIWTMLANGNYIYAGSGPDGAVLRTLDRIFWSKIFIADDTHVLSLYVQDNKLYIGTAPQGKIYIMDLSTETTTLSQTLGASIVSFLVFKDEFYVATGSPAMIYKFNSEDNRWNSFYKPYASVNSMLIFEDKMVVLLEGEDIVYFDGKHWYLEPLGNDNVKSHRQVETEPFSHVSYAFINRTNVRETSNTASEDIYDVFPMNYADGIKTAAIDGDSLVLGASNNGRVYSYVAGEVEEVATTTTTTSTLIPGEIITSTTTTSVGETTAELTIVEWIGGTHSHTATITQAEALSLVNNEIESITVTSTSILNHTHSVTIAFNGTTFEVTSITGNHGHAGLIFV